MEGVRETLCTSCNHRDVCSHKDDYLAMLKSLEETFNSFPKEEKDFMVMRDPECKFYTSKNEIKQSVIVFGNSRYCPDEFLKIAHENMRRLVGGI